MGQLLGPIGYFFNLIFTYPIFNTLMLLYHLIGDFGLSIIVLTLIVKLVLFPLTRQQLKSMKATQALQPHLAEVNKKHAKNAQERMAATQALYKEHGVNPVAGCLPMLIQLPALYGLFYAMNGVLRTTKLSDVNTKLYPFIPHFSKFPNLDLNWFTFISPSLHFSLGKPDPTHVLPLLAGVVTYIQLRMSQPKTVTLAKTNDPSAQTMKTMQLVTPFITVFFGWTFPAGLALYWTVSYMFQAVQQYFISGWGSLFIPPDFIKNMINSNNASQQENKRTSEDRPKAVRRATIADDLDTTENNDLEKKRSAVNGARSSSTQSARRRSRSTNSASARRRGNMAKSKPHK